MQLASLRIWITAFGIVSSAFAVQAQTIPTPPIKSGLWQVQMEREVNGQKVPDMSERLKNMPPEKRGQLEAMMKEHGVGMGGGPTRICYTKEMIEHSPWADMQTDCKPTFSSRTSSSWKWHTSCPKSGYEADGEAVFLNSENYTVKSTTVSKTGDKVRNSSTNITGKWMGADCGDVKPLDLKP